MATRGLFAGLFVVAIALGAPEVSQASLKTGKIDMDKGIAGVNLNLQRGPVRSKHAPRTVTSLLGRPTSESYLPRIGDSESEKHVYLAVYRDDGLAVYFSQRDRTNKVDNKKDRFDRVVGVTTYSPRFTGAYAVGKPLSTGNDGACAPLDARTGAGGGPRRVLACPVTSYKHAYGIIYLSAGNGSRASQRIQQVTLFKTLPGAAVFQSLVAGALEDLGCEDLQCTARG